ncbi:hypothetical protein FSC37_03605 [Piscinibacter aquaticus]|uniref:Dystroglycan-type cadherin-like domain-containing protein n=1 Tax=Piscinibacter aquaticus TaxID=392597 RepID=A0A5C6U188_9BURK|nr:hypothetical protein FSC37_03605 [Piscinibacter aquaticus]
MTVTDAHGTTSSQTFTLDVRAALAATTQVDNTVVQLDSPVGPFTPVVVTGGQQPYTFSVGPSLPAGLTMNPSTGEVTGTPSASTPMTDYTVTVVDASGARVLRSFRLATTAPIRLDVQPRPLIWDRPERP